MTARRLNESEIPPPRANVPVPCIPPQTSTRNLRLIMSNDQDARRERPTDPVGTMPPQSTPPAAVDSDARISASRLPGFDESSFLHRAMVAVIDGTNALLAAKQTYDIEAILQRQRVLFEEAIGPKLDTIAGRVTKTEDGLADLRKEFEQLKARMAQLEARIGKDEGTRDAAQTTTAPG